jgi:hypothetical protein
MRGLAFHLTQLRSCQYEDSDPSRPLLQSCSATASHTGKAIQSESTMPKSQARVASVTLWDIDSSGLVFARLSTLMPHRWQTRSGMRTRLRFTSFQSLVSRDPRSSSMRACPCRARSSHTARVPTAPMAILRKKLESGLRASRGIVLCDVL